MLLPRLSSLLLTASAVHALQTSSPFLLLSSKPLTSPSLQSAQIAFTQDVEDRLISSLSSCDTDRYFIFTHGEVSTRDLQNGAMPKLQRRASEGTGSVVQIPEVLVMGTLSAESIDARLREVCGADTSIVISDLPSMASDAVTRAQAMKDADDSIESKIGSAFDDSKLSSVFIYLTTPLGGEASEGRDTHLYEMDDPFPSAALHTDLKRDWSAHKRQADGNGNADFQAGLPLFEKYMFLSPALFMGLGVSILLFGILYVGVSAISGLEVSYMAFSKEMGPQASKGKQQ